MHFLNKIYKNLNNFIQTSILSVEDEIFLEDALNIQGKYLQEDLQHPSAPHFQLVQGHSR